MPEMTPRPFPCAVLLAVVVSAAVVIVRTTTKLCNGNCLTGKVCRAHYRQTWCWTPVHFGDRNYPDFWMKHRPKLGSQNTRHEHMHEQVVVHLRCGDILVYPHREYRMPCSRCVAALAGWVGKNVTLIGAGHDGTAQAKARCADYIQLYSKVLRRLGTTVNVRHPRKDEEDARFINGARRVLALVASSFVFSHAGQNLSNLRMISPTASQAPWWVHCATVAPADMTPAHEHRLMTC